MLRTFGILFLLGLLAACAPRHITRIVPPEPGLEQRVVYVATQRSFIQAGSNFGLARSGDLSFVRVAVSIPLTHETGQIEWRSEIPDPAMDFALVGFDPIGDIAQFKSALFDEIQPGSDEVVVFVHGYNTTVSEAVLRLAQIQTDFGFTNPAVLFSWHSAGDPRGYAYDRDSILFARDELEDLLTTLTRGGRRKVFVLAHSMGSQLVMEAMRQAAISNNRTMLDRIGGVALMSPDIDPDVFRSQAEAIGALPQPFLIFTSQQDRILRLSSLLAGSRPRLGRIDGAKAVAGLDVTVIDVSEFAAPRGTNHAIALTSPTAIAVLRRLQGVISEGAASFSNYLVLSQSAY